MNFENLLQQSSRNSDFQRLVQLCSSYGLNEQETNQIISDFKNGSFAQHDQSIDESFQQSIRDLDSQHYEQMSRSQHEQYSFKNQKNNTGNFYQHNKHSISQNDSLEQDSKRSTRNKPQNIQINSEILQKFINERRQFERNIYKKVEEQVETLKLEIKQKQQRISSFVKMKMQDSDTIVGLKDSLLNMANLLQQKDRAYYSLLEKYQKLKLQNDSISTQKTSKVQFNHQQSINSLQQRKSMIKQKQRQKQNCLTQMDQNRIAKKSSQKYIKDPTSRNSIKNTDRLNTQQSRETITMQKNEQTKRSGIDINKYKGMIEKLRNSYQLR